MRIWVFHPILSAALLALAPQALAETGSDSIPETQQDFAAFEVAREMLLATGFKENLSKTAVRSADLFFNEGIASAEKETGPIDDELKAQIRVVVAEEVHQIAGDMQDTALDDAAHIYARHFTLEELRRLREINTDPVMKKAQTLLPQMMPELMQVGIRAAEKRKPKMKQRIHDLVEQWFADHGKKGTSL
ncbi:MAG: DUF2059 domain-containing protein [Sphingobium sp.]|nr:DUF2059 domain-containing protein [Sphingobium sp.]MCP5398600.1 DUF2059 domain-containing protein [Sphingomonas sp.]